ncbi:MAG: TIGR04086 family membrane protein [Clostridia bacterium]|nr:TIGR04086 family membrane protein [Clostridia bacterium]
MNKEATVKNTVTKEESEFKKNLFRILKGSIFAIVLSVVLLLIFALLLTHTNLSENTITPVILTITGISILVGSSISSMKIKKNGLMNGGTVGLIYILVLYLASSLCFTGFSLTTNSLIMLVIGVVTGILGGIIGVNLK